MLSNKDKTRRKMPFGNIQLGESFQLWELSVRSFSAIQTIRWRRLVDDKLTDGFVGRVVGTHSVACSIKR